MTSNPATDATLITVAPTGAEADKTAVAALPVTLDELVTTAKECQAAGASVVHVHIRDSQAQPTLDLSRLTDTVAALREGTDLIVQLSTGGAVTDSFGDRLAVLDAAPDACSLTCGTVNFGDEVFHNPWPFICDRPVTGNTELVERAATLAGLAQRPPMRPAQARAMLGVSERH